MSALTSTPLVGDIAVSSASPSENQKGGVKTPTVIWEELRRPHEGKVELGKDVSGEEVIFDRVSTASGIDKLSFWLFIESIGIQLCSPQGPGDLPSSV